MRLLKPASAVFALALVTSLSPCSFAQQNQPHMRAAIQHLEAAKAELQRAEHDKAGHREKALQLTDDALREVNEGIAAGARHGQLKAPALKSAPSAPAAGK